MKSMAATSSASPLSSLHYSPRLMIPSLTSVTPNTSNTSSSSSSSSSINFTMGFRPSSVASPLGGTVTITASSSSTDGLSNTSSGTSIDSLSSATIDNTRRPSVVGLGNLGSLSSSSLHLSSSSSKKGGDYAMKQRKRGRSSAEDEQDSRHGKQGMSTDSILGSNTVTSSTASYLSNRDDPSNTSQSTSRKAKRIAKPVSKSNSSTLTATGGANEDLGLSPVHTTRARTSNQRKSQPLATEKENTASSTTVLDNSVHDLNVSMGSTTSTNGNNNNNSNNNSNANGSSEPSPKKRKTSKKDQVMPSFKNETCGICFDTFETRGMLDCCPHMYCVDCITKWSSTSNTCPQCKRRFKKIESFNLDGKKLKTYKTPKKDMCTSTGLFGRMGSDEYFDIILQLIMQGVQPRTPTTVHEPARRSSTQSFDSLISFRPDEPEVIELDTSPSAHSRRRRIRQPRPITSSTSNFIQGTSRENPVVLDDSDCE